jgi:hypothetical protein
MQLSEPTWIVSLSSVLPLLLLSQALPTKRLAQAAFAELLEDDTRTRYFAQIARARSAAFVSANFHRLETLVG